VAVGWLVALAVDVAEGAAVDVAVGGLVAVAVEVGGTVAVAVGAVVLVAVGVLRGGELSSLEQAARVAQSTAVRSESRNDVSTIGSLLVDATLSPCAAKRRIARVLAWRAPRS
jgi:hypothetical protein